MEVPSLGSDLIGLQFSYQLIRSIPSTLQAAQSLEHGQHVHGFSSDVECPQLLPSSCRPFVSSFCLEQKRFWHLQIFQSYFKHGSMGTSLLLDTKKSPKTP
jgi:hypothetical protein